MHHRTYLTDSVQNYNRQRQRRARLRLHHLDRLTELLEHLERLASGVADAIDPVLRAAYVSVPEGIARHHALGSWILLPCHGIGFTLCFRVAQDGTFSVERAAGLQTRRDREPDEPHVEWTAVGNIASLSTTGTRQGPEITLIALDGDRPSTQALEDFLTGQIDQRRDGEAEALDRLVPIIGVIGH